MVDDGNYAQSWSEAGVKFKATTSADAWAKQAAAVREPLGAMSDRNLKDVNLSRTQTQGNRVKK